MRRILTRQISFILIASLIIFPVVLSGQQSKFGDADITKCWSYLTEATPPLSISALNSHIFLGMPGGELESLNRNGRKLWSTDLGGTISSNIMPIKGSVLVVTTIAGANRTRKEEAILRSLSSETGVPNWSRQMLASASHLLHPHRGWVIVVSSDGSVQALDAATGTAVWKVNVLSGLSANPIFTPSTMLVPSASKHIFTIDLSTGDIVSTRTVSHSITAIVGGPGGEVIAGDERGNIISLSSTNERPDWKFKTGGQISTFVRAGPNILAASHDNFVYSLVARSGHVLWKRRLAARAAILLNIDDRLGLLAAVEDQGTAIIDLKSGKVAGLMPRESGETFAGDLIVFEGLIVASTNRGVHGYSDGSCVDVTKSEPPSASANTQN